MKNMKEFTQTAPKRRDREYRAYLEELIAEFNSNGKKTVLMSCDAYFPVFDGVVNVLDNYARAMCGEMNVLVLVPTFAGRVHLRDYPAVGVTSLYSRRLSYQVALPAFDRSCRRLLRSLRIDLIHCHSPFFLGRYVLRLHKRRNIPMITTFHSQYRRDFEKYVGKGRLNRFLLKFIMKVFNESDEVWTMHPVVGEVLRSYGYAGPIRYLPNATAVSAPRDYAAERTAAREKFSLRQEELLFVFVGRLVVQKNILFIAEVLGELKRRGLRFRMMYVGEGPDRGKLLRKLKEENVEQDVVFAGHVGEEASLCEIYAAADLLLFPSFYDTFGLVKLEAASRRTPTVLAEGSCAAAGVTHGENGFVLPVEKGAFADGVMEAVRDRARLEAVGENAFRDLFIGWGDVMETAKTYYGELIASEGKERQEKIPETT